MRLRVGGWSVRVGGYKLSVGSSRLMIEGWIFIGRGVREDSLDGRVLDSSGDRNGLENQICQINFPTLLVKTI